MEEDELRKILKEDIPKEIDIECDSKELLLKCKQQSKQKNKIVTMVSLVLSSFVIIAVLSVLILTNKTSKYVNVSFKIQDITFDAKIDKGTKLTTSNISYLRKIDYCNLYYDDEKKNKYNNESVDEDMTIYVELDEKDYSNMNEEEVLLQIRNDYLNQYVIPTYGEEYTYDGIKYKYNIDDVNILKNLGCYNESYVVLFRVSGAGVGWNTTKEYVIGGVSLVFPNAANIPYVWKNGYFYYLETAFNNELLTVDDLEAIALILNGENNK